MIPIEPTEGMFVAVTRTKRLHLGCGHNAPQGWVNLDGSWNARLSKYPGLRKLLKVLHVVPASLLDIIWDPNILIHDVRKPLPFEDDTLSAIYASHLLEHLYLEEAKRLLKECLRVLEPGGVLRMVVPDLRAIVSEYWEEKQSVASATRTETVTAADKLNMKLLLHPPMPPSGNALYRLYTTWKDFHSHKWMYDAESLVRYFQWAGYIDVQEMAFHHSRIPGIETIEEAGRVLNGAGICVEGIKPHWTRRS